MQFSRYIVCLRSPSGLFREDPKKRPGSHLLSHAVPSIVPSAAQGLTIVFGMGTGVSPERIATGKVLFLTTEQQNNLYLSFLRKEVIQPHLPIRLPCYDFTPVTGSTFDSSLLKGWVTGFGHFRLPWCDGRCVQDPGTYSPQHSDLRLLAIPASCSRVADCSPNWDSLFVVRSPSRVRLTL